MNFIDLEKVYNRMYDVGGKLLSAIRSIYDSLACVKVKRSES